MGRLTRIALFFLMIWAHLRVCQARPKKRHHHSIFMAAPKRFHKSFLQEYGKKSIEAFNKQSKDKYKYILLDVIGAKANEETKSLELMMKFGRTRCQKTEDRYFCQTTPEMKIEELLFKVDISKKQTDAVEYKFEEKPVDTLPAVQKLFRETVED